MSECNIEGAGVSSWLQLRLQQFQTVLEYLDQSGNLKLIKAQCHKYSRTKNLVFMFKLMLDPTEVCEADAELGNLLLQQHDLAASIFQQVVLKVVQVLDLLPGEVCLSQVAVVLRLSTLPVLKNVNTIESVRCLSRVHDVGVFCRLKGVVTGLSAISKYTLSTRYHCADDDCDGFHGNHFIRVHVAGASEAQTIRKDFKCTFCYCTLVEEKSSRTLSERVVAEVIPEQMISLQSHHHDCSRLQAIPVYIRDDLTKVVEIGECFDIIGMTRKDIKEDSMALTIEANNIQKVKVEISTKKLLQEIPRDVLKLYKDRKSSPWSFVLTLAYLFGGDICPVGSYFNLKLLLLLSIMSRLDTKSKPVHVLAIGSDIEMISRLLQFSLRFQDSATTLTAGHSLIGHVTADKYNSAPYFVEGGVLHLSKGGVCYIGDVSRLKKSTIQQLQSALSGGKVVTNVGSKFTGGLPHHIEQPLASHIWAYSDNNTSKKGKSHTEDEVFIPSRTGNVPIPLLESFSLVCFTDSGDMTSYDIMSGQSVNMLLSNAMVTDTTSNIPISSQDFQQFVKFAGRLRPKYSKEAETLIHSYYLTSRKSRSTPDGTDVPVNADQTMLSMAYSHSKLALRNEVTIQDALIAIRLYEEYLSVRFGYSTLSVQPVPHVTPDLLSHCIGPENDIQMKLFHTNLLRYCSLASGFEE